MADALDEVPTTSRASHPLVRSFYEAFASSSSEVQRENISGLTNPHWWKQKASRWRGAATATTLETADEARASGAIPSRLWESHLHLGVRAHYTRKDGIVSATMDGEAVRALCGVWIVPTTDPNRLPICTACETQHTRLP